MRSRKRRTIMCTCCNIIVCLQTSDEFAPTWHCHNTYRPMLLAAPRQVNQERVAIDGVTRHRLRGELASALRDGGVVLDSLGPLAARLEACALAHARNQSDLYMASVSRMVFNLRHNGEAILQTYALSRVCRLSHKRMEAETAHALRDTVMEARVKQLLADAEAAANEHMRRANEKKSDRAIRCPKCKTQTGIMRTTQQTRAADEGMVTTCMCRGCGWKWNLAS
jgi:DNA-directed RNA polymerase subunit M/transcription elongation factor TFIIS